MYSLEVEGTVTASHNPPPSPLEKPKGAICRLSPDRKQSFNTQLPLCFPLLLCMIHSRLLNPVPPK